MIPSARPTTRSRRSRKPVVPRSVAAPQYRQPTVLLVEDELLVRELIVEVLEMTGHRVLTARDGREALRAAAAYPGPIDLLLTDVMLPGMTGGELAKQVAAIRPEARVLFMSGYDEQDVRGITGCADVREIIPKPFDWRTFTNRIRMALEATSQP